MMQEVNRNAGRGIPGLEQRTKAAAEPRRQSQTESAVQVLAQCAETLEQNFEVLAVKLLPLIPPLPEKEGRDETGVPNEMRAELPQRIEVQAERVRRVAFAMAKLCEKIEL